MDSTTPKPVLMPVQEANIPDELKSLDRWVSWSWHWKTEEKKWDKPPLNSRTGGKAKSNLSATWSTFDTAIKAYRSGEFEGIGFVLGSLPTQKNLAGLDLDDVRDPITGEIAPWAMWVIGTLDTYCEISPSATGAKMLCYANFAGQGKKRDTKKGVELFESGIYFTITGNLLPGTPATINNRSSQFNNLRQTLLSEPSYQEQQEDPRQTALNVLPFVNIEKVSEYEPWIAVGMALHSVSDDLLDAWDEWSRKCSEKYVEGACAKKWRGFRRGGGLRLNSLVWWAKQNGYDHKRHNKQVKTKTVHSGGSAAETNGRHYPPLTESAKSAAVADRAPVDPISWLSSFGLDVSRVIKLGKKRGVFDLELKTKETIQIGPMGDMVNPKSFQIAVADATRILIPLLKQTDWRPIAQELIKMAEHLDVDSDPQAELRELIESFAAQHANKVCVDESAAIDSLVTFGIAKMSDGTIHLNLVKFMSAILSLNPSKFTRADLIQRLYRDGFKREQLFKRDAQKPKQVKGWKSEAGYLS